MATSQMVARADGQASPVPEGTLVTLMLPWAEQWVTEGKIFWEFRQLGWGYISKVDMVSVEKGKRPHQKVFIHFSSWDDKYKDVLEHLSQEPTRKQTSSGHRAMYPELKVYYNDTFYWKVRKSEWKLKPRQEVGRTPRVEFVTVPKVVPTPKGFSGVVLSSDGELVAKSEPEPEPEPKEPATELEWTEEGEHPAQIQARQAAVEPHSPPYSPSKRETIPFSEGTWGDSEGGLVM